MPRYNRWITVTTIVGLTVLAYFCFATPWLARYWPISRVYSKSQLIYQDRKDLEAVVARYSSAGFFGLNLSALARELESLPWVKSARVTRHWPDSLELSVIEPQPLALLNSDKVLDKSGEIYDLNSTAASFANLPVLLGSTSDSLALAKNFHSFSKQLATIGASIVELELKPSSGWRVKLDNGVTIVLGRRLLEQRLARFVISANKILTKNTSGVTLDLRYTNGIAVAGG